MDFCKTLDMVHLWWLVATNQRASQPELGSSTHHPSLFATGTSLI